MILQQETVSVSSDLTLPKGICGHDYILELTAKPSSNACLSKQDTYSHDQNWGLP